MKLPFLSLCIAALIACAGCGSGPASPLSAAAPTSADVASAYRLGTGDRLRISVFGEDKLTGEFTVGDRGAISFPLVGEVQADQRTVAELKSSLVAELKAGYLLDPRVTVEVMTYRPYYVLGEVGKPGEYAYTNGLTVLNAVAAASGFTYRANTKRVFIKGPADAAERAVPLTAAQAVRPGDTIRIGERYF